MHKTLILDVLATEHVLSLVLFSSFSNLHRVRTPIVSQSGIVTSSWRIIASSRCTLLPSCDSHVVLINSQASQWRIHPNGKPFPPKPPITLAWPHGWFSSQFHIKCTVHAVLYARKALWWVGYSTVLCSVLLTLNLKQYELRPKPVKLALRLHDRKRVVWK